MNATIQLRGFLPQEQHKIEAAIVSPKKHTAGERKWREAKRLRQREERKAQQNVQH